MNPEIPNHRRESRVILTLGTAIGLSLLALGIAVFATIRSYLDLRLVHEQRQQGERMMDMVLQADYLRIEALSRAAADGDTEQGEAYEEAFDLLSEALVGSSFVWDLPLHSGMHEIWMAASDLRVTEEEILDRVAAGSLREARWLLMDSAYLKERAEFREALRNTHYSFTSFVQQKSERARARLRVIWQSSAAGLLVLAGAWVILFRLLARHLRARQRAEFALSESEEKYRSLIEALPHAVVLVQDTRIVYCNRAAAAMWGYSDAEKLVGLSGYKVVAEQDCERSIAYHEARMRGETDVPDHYVVHMTRAGGEEFPAEIYVRMVTFRGCDAAQIVAIDISERQRAEDALRESEERFRSLADTAPVLIWMVGVKRHMFYFNRGWQTFTGRSIAQLYGQGWKEDVHPEDVERCLDSYERAFEARRQYTTEYRLRRSDGSYHTVLETGVPRFTRDGSFSGYIGSCVDISDRLDAELALRESERALSTLISNIPGMVYRCRNDRDWTMTFASEDGCRNLTGYAPADILENRRLSYNDLIHPDDRERIWNEVQEALSKRQTFHLEYRIHTAGGSQKWVAEQGQGVFGPDGSVLFVEGLISDATESKLAAEAQTRLLDFERIVLSVSNHFINLPLENTDEGIQDALQIVGEAASVDRAYVFLLRDQGRIADNTHEWCAEGISSEIENLQNIDPDHDLPFFARLIRNREVIQISQVNDLPEEAAAERAEMERESIQSLVIVPMVAGGHILGFVGFDSVRCQRDWSEDEIAILRILADVIASVVDRRSTAEARGVSEARFKSILKAAPTGIGVLVDRVFVEVNEAFCSMTGYSANEVIGKSARMIYPTQEDFEYVGREKYGQIAEKGSGTAETQWRRKDGTVIDILLSSSLIDPKNLPAGVTFTATDITERKRAEEQLRRSREEWHTIFHAVGHPAFILNPQQEVIAANRTALLTLGMSEQDVAGKKCWELFHSPELDAPPPGCPMKAMLASGEMETTEMEIEALGGHFLVSCTPVLGSDGQLEKVIHVATDVSELKRAETEVRTERDRAQGYLDIAGTIIVALNRQGEIMLINRKGCRILGCLETEIVGRDWFETCLPPPVRDAVRDFFRRSMEGVIEMPEYYENNVLTGNGERTIAWHNTVIRDDDERIIGTLSSGEDITERKQAEEELVRRTQELERSNSELERFAYVASHDLQEPLRMMSSYAELLKRRYEGQLDRDADDYVGYIVEGADRMQQLIRDLLAYSRMDVRGKRFEKIDCAKILEAVLENLQLVIEENQAVITHDSLPLAHGDKTQVVQLFQNLIGNAIKFRGQDAPRIHVGCADKNAHWEFSVSDNGIGIEAEYFDRIFVVFRRLHKRDEYPGTGIGLAICKKIVERHGGRIWVESQPGEGTTFRFNLPKSQHRDSARRSR